MIIQYFNICCSNVFTLVNSSKLKFINYNFNNEIKNGIINDFTIKLGLGNAESIVFKNYYLEKKWGESQTSPLLQKINQQLKEIDNKNIYLN